MALRNLGKLQSGTVASKEFAFYNLAGGLNVKSAPQNLPDEDLTVALNGYLRTDGGFQMRNGMSFYNAVFGGLTNEGLVNARFYQDILNGSPVTEKRLVLSQVYGSGVAGVGNLYSVPSGAVAGSLIGNIGGSAASPMTTARIQNPNDPHYTSGLTDCTVICSGSGGPYVYDGTYFYTPAGWSNAAGAKWCAVVNGILWFGGIATYPNQIFGTGDGLTDSMESLPAYRNFIFSAPVTGLCAQGTGANAALVVGCNSGLSVLYGTGPSTFYKQDIPFADGVTAGRTMVSDAGIVYFLGQNAVYAFDGQTVPRPISKKVEPWILNDPFTLGYPMTQNRGLSWACVYNNRLHIGYCSAVPTPDTVLVYDLVTQGWTVITPSLFLGDGLLSMCLLDAPGDADPYQALVGTSASGRIMNWDFVPADTTQPVYDDAPNNTVAVLSQVQSKFFKIGVPGTTKALMRFYPEFQVSGNFVQPFTVVTDYGAATTNALLDNVLAPGATTGIWDTSDWDQATWGGFSGFGNFGPPASRLDFPGVQAESFAFGVNMNSASAPWVWSGGSGTYSQRSRT